TLTADELKEVVTIKKIDKTTKNESIVVNFDVKYIEDNEGKPIKVEFLASVNQDADLSAYRNVPNDKVSEVHSELYGDNPMHAEIPNIASYTINNKI
ncbi:hypothetical protein, partial [Salmonella sp. ZJHZ20_0179]|uniref:hypothetical protein n=1 Tax=Salmonella sp. ZJHZ20_0179 TaxID=3159596 RepID=UPI00397D8E77